MRFYITAVLIMIVSVVRSFSLAGKKQSQYALNRVLKLSAGAGGEMEPFYALGVNVARQVGGELKSILSKEEISAMLDVSVRKSIYILLMMFQVVETLIWIDIYVYFS